MPQAFGKSSCIWVVAALLCGAGSAHAQHMSFDDLPGGTLFGVAAGDLPAEIVYSKNGIDMAVDSFFLGSFTGFYDAEVGGIYSSAFGTPALELDNIAVVFTFGGLGFDVTQLSFDFVEFGGGVNFSVNGGSILELDSLSALPADLGGGVSGDISGGVLTLTAPASPITSLRIGGQELVIDNLAVIPEPATTLLLVFGATVLWRQRRATIHQNGL